MKIISILFLAFALTVIPVFADDFVDGIVAYGEGDYQTAFDKLMPLAKQGNAKAQMFLGNMHEDGLGVPQDFKEAFKWYSLAAKQGNADAQLLLGVMYEVGHGVTQDDKEAFKWYSLAAKQGVAQAQYNLGFIYKEGIGVPQDYVEAHKWYNITGINGNKVGRKNAILLEKKMTPTQIAEAQKLAREWMEKQK